MTDFNTSTFEGSHNISTALYLAQLCANANTEANNSGYADYVNNLKEITIQCLKQANEKCLSLVKDAVAFDVKAVARVDKNISSSLGNYAKQIQAAQLYKNYIWYVKLFDDIGRDILDEVPFYPCPKHTKAIADCHKMFEHDRMTVIEDDLKSVKDTLASLTSELKSTKISQNLAHTNENLVKIQAQQEKLTKSQSENTLALKALDKRVLEGNKTTDSSAPREERPQHTYASTLSVPRISLNGRPRSDSRASRRQLSRSPARAVQQSQGNTVSKKSTGKAVGTGELTNDQEGNWSHAGKKVTRAIKLTFESTWTVERLKEWIKTVEYLSEFLPKMEFLVTSKTDRFIAIRVVCKGWPQNGELAFQDSRFWPEGVAITVWRGEITEQVTESKIVKKHFSNLSAQTTAEGIKRVVTELYQNDADHEQIYVNVHELNCKTKGLKSFCVVIGNKNDVRPQDLLSRDWARSTGITVFNWSGPLPKVERTPVTIN